MIRRKAERLVNVSENRYGGSGQVMMTAILNGHEELGGKGRLFSHITLKPGCGIGEHNHEGEWEAFYVLSGQGQLTDNGEIYTLQAGDVHLCPSGHSHGVHNAGSETLEMVALILYA
ncbi:MAG: cupin domain-containing protein [Eubacteriales bacterium]|nr:cupin domain-containing protein [Eubacteriales bacterium]